MPHLFLPHALLTDCMMPKEQLLFLFCIFKTSLVNDQFYIKQHNKFLVFIIIVYEDDQHTDFKKPSVLICIGKLH